MLAKVADAFLLLALTVIIHAAGLTIVLRRLPLRKTADWLFVLVPVTAVLEHAGKRPPPLIFFSAALRAPHQSNIII
jgi:hypothetical protein